MLHRKDDLNNLLILEPESSWFTGLNTSMKKCRKFHLHIHSDAHSMLIAITADPLAIMS